MDRAALIPGYPDYAVVELASNPGAAEAVWSKKSGEWLPLKPVCNGNGYPMVNLYRGARHTREIHQIKLVVFVGPCPEDQECLHRNGNPRDFSLANIHWGTQSENSADRNKHGWNPARGERCGTAKLTDAQVIKIRSQYAAGGVTQRQLAREYGVNRSLISRIVNCKYWKHLLTKGAA
jgi:hypothetical protein